ncbi:MAG: tRNA pseudouridine(13) synthase TruD [Planctomycetota bacterium]|nr:tRNA pseudouridine(13) synthase TruD [Planctomycetota bacterium]
MRIRTPLAQRYFTGEEGIGGRLKVRAEDFIVEEIPLYEPCGEGEHLYLRVEKTDVAHAELMSCLRRQFGVTDRAIGYAGMKDKRAVTRQWVSIHLTDEPASLDIDHARVRVVAAVRHRNKLRRGHLRGNRFDIRLRDVDPDRAPRARRILERLEEIGVPGYFGSQRFGYRGNNHKLGALLLNRDWDGVLAELLGTTGSPFPEHQRRRRELFDAGRHEEARALWTPADRAELIAIKKLCTGASPRETALACGRIVLHFWTSSLMSAAFNRLLDQRIDAGTVDRLQEGDLAWKHDNRAVFAVTADELATGELAGRLARFEISPTGPLWGEGMPRAGGAVDEVEREALDATGVSMEDLAASRYRPDGGRRPFRQPVRNARIDAGTDEHGPYIRACFDLPRGTYATIAMREITKSDGGDTSDTRDGDESGDGA